MRLRRPIARALIILVLVGLVALPGAAAPTSAPRTGGVPVRVKRTPRCSLFAPAGWTVTGNPQGSTADNC